MSHMGQSLNNWLRRQGYSMMMQEQTVCQLFTHDTQENMVRISEISAKRFREMGTPINQDYGLGEVRTGTRDRVLIPRPTGTIGTFHTHPFGIPKPSTYDILEGLTKGDEVSCIGASGKIGTKIACYTPKDPKWSELRTKLAALFVDINEFNRTVGGKYRKRGVDLRKLLKRVGSLDYVQAVQATPRHELEIDEEKAKSRAEEAVVAVEVADERIEEANDMIKTAQAELDGAITDEQTKEAGAKLRRAMEEADRAVANAEHAHELAYKAKEDAEEAIFKAEIRARGVTPAESEEANQFIIDGANLENRRQVLIDEINRQLLFMGYKEEWRPQIKADGWEPEPVMFDSCKIIWEHLPTEEELGYEL